MKKTNIFFEMAVIIFIVIITVSYVFIFRSIAEGTLSGTVILGLFIFLFGYFSRNFLDPCKKDYSLIRLVPLVILIVGIYKTLGKFEHHIVTGEPLYTEQFFSLMGLEGNQTTALVLSIFCVIGFFFLIVGGILDVYADKLKTDKEIKDKQITVEAIKNYDFLNITFKAPEEKFGKRMYIATYPAFMDWAVGISEVRENAVKIAKFHKNQVTERFISSLNPKEFFNYLITKDNFWRKKLDL